MDQVLKIVFYFLFCYTLTNFGQLLREQPHSPVVHHCILSMFDPKGIGYNILRLGP